MSTGPKKNTPTNPGVTKTSTKQPCATCQKAPAFACDVDTLEISAREAGGDARSVKASKRLRQKPSAEERKTYPSHVHQHLQNFDIILDCAAGFKDNYFMTTDSPETVQQLSAEATFHKAGNCPTREHQKISAKVVSGSQQRLAGSSKNNTTQLVNWPGDAYVQNATSIKWPPSNEVRSFLANPIFTGSAKETNDFTFLFYFLHALMDTKTPRMLQVVAEGHGTRKDKNPVRQSLRGLIRIYREDTFKLVFAYTGVGKEVTTEPPERAASGDEAANLAAAKAKAKTPPKKKLVAVAQQTKKAATKGFVDIVRQAKSNAVQDSISIDVQLNNQSLMLMDKERQQQVTQLYAKARQLQLHRMLPDLRGGAPSLGVYFSVLWVLSVDAIKKNIRNILTTVQNCVKYGLWMEFSLAFFDGILGFKYATKDGKSYPRYNSIVHGFSLFFEWNVVHINFSLNFGVKANFGPIASVWAYVFVALEFLVQLNGELSLDSDNAGEVAWGVVSQGVLSAGATGGARVLGMGISVNAEARSTLRVAFSWSIANSGNRKPQFEHEGSLTPITFDYHAEAHLPGMSNPKGMHGQWQPWGTREIKLWKGKAN